MSVSCPRCRSEKISHDGVLELATCEYCTNNFYPVSHDELLNAISNAESISFRQFKNPLKIRDVTDEDSLIRVHLDGRNGGEYRLKISSDYTSKLQRRKGPSERNQFGSRWTDLTGDTWPTKID